MIKNNDFRDITMNRRSVRSYDKDHKISKDLMSKILRDATRSPSSTNSQPWRFIVVESAEAKARLKPYIRFNTLQNETSSAMILIFADMDCIDNAAEIYDQAVNEGKMTQEVRDAQLEMIVPYYKNKSAKQVNDIVRLDVGLVAMQLMLVARSYGYDTCPIGGFEEDMIAEAFDLDKARYLPTVIISIGKAVEEGFESVRLPVDRVTTWL